MYFENDERSAYLKARGKVILNACPGSGKTTTIAKKIIELEYLNEIGGIQALLAYRLQTLLRTKLMKRIEN